MAALSPHSSVSRTEVSARLWPDASRERAQANLRYVVTAIRKWQRENGVDVLAVTNDRLVSQGNSDLEALLGNGNDTSRHPPFSGLLAGDLLEGHGGDNSEFDEWLRTKRRTG
ncbi:MAG: hypothetical protein JWQ27_3336 [Ferruginibacter sp.]|nr:hypothetical protein [Ferruginibacter sp.]